MLPHVRAHEVNGPSPEDIQKHVLPPLGSRGRGEDAQVLVLLLIVLAIVGGGLWYLKSARDRKEQDARAFANDLADHVILQGDQRMLDLVLSPDAKLRYPPSWRERMFQHIREQGAPQSPMQLTGDVSFQNHFFDPTGHFRAQVQYVDGPAILEMIVDQPGVMWEVEELNWIWQPSSYQPAPIVPSSPPPAATPPNESRP